MQQSSSINSPHVLAVTFEAGDNDPRVLSSDPPVDPSAASGVAAVEGSIYLKYAAAAGQAWLKTGVAATAWTQLASLSPAGPFLAPDGTVVAPSYSFANDTDVGMYLNGVGDLGFSVAGISRLNLTSAAATFSGEVRVAAGTAADPGIQFSGDLDTGFFGEVGACGVSVAGVEVQRWAGGQALAVDGTVGAPAFAFASDTDSGMYLNGTNLEFVTGGVFRLRIGAGGIVFSSSAQLADNIQLLFGGGFDTVFLWSQSQTPNCFVTGLGETSKTWLICDKADIGTNFLHANQLDPTTFWQNSDANSIHGYGGICHDDDAFTFSSGRGGHSFALVAQHAQGTMTLTGLPTAEDTFVINATTVTAKASGATGDEFNIGVDAAATILNLVAAINAGTESANVKAWDGAGDTVVFEWIVAGVAGNAIVFTESLDNTTIDGGGTLGGTHAGVAASTPLIANDAGVAVSGSLFRSVTAGITASTTQTQAGGTALTADFNFVSTVANPSDAVTMPTAVAGMEVVIANDSANVLQIFPGVGDDIGAGVNLSRTLDANERIEFIAMDATTWDVEASTEITHAEYTQNSNTNAFVISVINQFHLYHSDTLAGGDLSNWTFDGGGDGTVPDITVVADGGGGTSIDVTTGAAHGVVAGSVVSITNTGDANYDTIHVVNSINGANEFNVTATWGVTATGSLNHGASLTCPVGLGGTYKWDLGACAFAANNNDNFDFFVYVNAVQQMKTEIRRKFSTGTDFGSFAKPALLTIADGDVITWGIKNLTGAGNITVRTVNLVLSRK